MREAKKIKSVLLGALCKNGLNEALVNSILLDSNISFSHRQEDRLVVRCGAESQVMVDVTLTSGEPDAKVTKVNIFEMID